MACVTWSFVGLPCNVTNQFEYLHENEILIFKDPGKGRNASKIEISTSRKREVNSASHVARLPEQ